MSQVFAAASLVSSSVLFFFFFFLLVRRGGIINNEDYVCSMLDAKSARVKIIRRIIVLLSSILISVVKSMTVSCKNLKNHSKLN